MNELPEDLERAWRVLDARAARRAHRVDPERVASRVRERLASEPALKERVFASPMWQVVRDAPRWAMLAAAAVVVLTVGTVAGGTLLRSGGGERTLVFPVVAQALEKLNTEQLETVLQVAGEVKPLAAEPRQAAAAPWDNLSEEQLRAVLQAVQQVEGETL